jgi:hypothetical protein
LRRVIEVDMATRRQVIEFALPSKWDVPPFQAALEIWWRVVDPAEIVRLRISDMGGEFLARHMVKLRRTAREFPYAASAEAEKELNMTLPHQECWLVDGAAKVLRVYLRVDQDELVHGHQMDHLDERHRAHITGIRRETLAKFMTDGQTGMLAFHLTQHPDDALDVAEALAAQEQVSLETSLQIMFQAVNSGKIQDVEAERLHDEAIKKLLDKVRSGPKALQKLKDQHQAAIPKASTPSVEQQPPAENAAEKTVVDAEVVAEETDD